MKALIYIIVLRFFAVIDVLFAQRFELRTYKNGRLTATTKFCKKEIKAAFPNFWKFKNEGILDRGEAERS